MKYFRVKTFYFSAINEPIKEIEVQAETAKTITIDGRKCLKNSKTEHYFPTYEEAVQFAIRHYEWKIQMAEFDIIRTQREISVIKEVIDNLTKPNL